MGVGNPTIGRCLVLVEPVYRFCIEIRGFQAVAQTEVSPVGLEFQWAILALLAWQPTENKAERPVGKASPSGKLQMGFAFRICLTLKQLPKTTPEGTFSKVVSEPESSHNSWDLSAFCEGAAFWGRFKETPTGKPPWDFSLFNGVRNGNQNQKKLLEYPRGPGFSDKSNLRSCCVRAPLKVLPFWEVFGPLQHIQEGDSKLESLL